jgi:hypothetical protein
MSSSRHNLSFIIISVIYTRHQRIYHQSSRPLADSVSLAVLSLQRVLLLLVLGVIVGGLGGPDDMLFDVPGSYELA